MPQRTPVSFLSPTVVPCQSKLIPASWFPQSTAGLGLQLVKSIIQSTNQIIGVFNSHADSNEPICYANLESVLTQHISMSHNSTRRDDTFSGAKILAQCPGTFNSVMSLMGSPLTSNQSMPPWRLSQ